MYNIYIYIAGPRLIWTHPAHSHIWFFQKISPGTFMSSCTCRVSPAAVERTNLAWGRRNWKARTVGMKYDIIFDRGSRLEAIGNWDSIGLTKWVGICKNTYGFGWLKTESSSNKKRIWWSSKPSFDVDDPKRSSPLLGAVFRWSMTNHLWLHCKVTHLFKKRG